MNYVSTKLIIIKKVTFIKYFDVIHTNIINEMLPPDLN